MLCIESGRRSVAEFKRDSGTNSAGEVTDELTMFAGSGEEFDTAAATGAAVGAVDANRMLAPFRIMLFDLESWDRANGFEREALAIGKTGPLRMELCCTGEEENYVSYVSLY